MNPYEKNPFQRALMFGNEDDKDFANEFLSVKMIAPQVDLGNIFIDTLVDAYDMNAPSMIKRMITHTPLPMEFLVKKDYILSFVIGNYNNKDFGIFNHGNPLAIGKLRHDRDYFSFEIFQPKIYNDLIDMFFELGYFYFNRNLGVFNNDNILKERMFTDKPCAETVYDNYK
ncbi:MAG: hypothetical protein ACQER9_04330 [Nanobdellota archaeon]